MLDVLKLKRIVIKLDSAQKFKRSASLLKKVAGSEVTLTHKAECPSNYFSSSCTLFQAKQLKKGVICVQILLEIHQTEQSRVHFQG